MFIEPLIIPLAESIVAPSGDGEISKSNEPPAVPVISIGVEILAQ